jgi:hypothetical protein
VKAIDKELRDLARPLRDELKPPEVPEPCEAMSSSSAQIRAARATAGGLRGHE